MRTDFDAEGLRRLARQSKHAAQASRLLALALIYNGGSRSDAARLGSVTRQIVRDWVMRFSATGPDGLVDGKAPGPKSLLTDAQRAALAEAMERGPTRPSCSSFKQAMDQASATLSELNKERLFLDKNTKQARAALKAEIPDADFFARPHEVIQVLNVWFDKDTNRLRDQVFVEAMRLHRAFIDCAADPLRQNLSVFMETFGTRTLGTSKKDALTRIADHPINRIDELLPWHMQGPSEMS